MTIASVVAPHDSSITIARVELGLTLYLAEPLRWAHEGAARVLASFLAIVPPDRLSYYATSRMEQWRKLDGEAFAQMQASLSLPWSERRPRHLMRFVVTDDPMCPSYGFRYEEVDPDRAGRAGLIEITLPQELDAGYLLPIARAAVAAGPLYCGIGGYAVRLSERYLADAFDIAWAWSRRYAGIDIQHTEGMVWRAPEGLAGANWLTIAGRSIDATSHTSSFVDPDIRAETIEGQLLLIAGTAPRLIDANRFESAGAYAEVAQALAPFFVPERPLFLGRFRDDASSRAWFTRLTR